MDTLHKKLDSLRKRLSDCQKELKQTQKDLKAEKTSTCESCNAFRKAVGSESKNHKHKKRRLDRAQTPNNFWNLNF